MSVLDKNNKSKKSYFSALEDTSIDMTKTPNSLEELKKAARGNVQNKTKKSRGRPKSELQDKEVVSLFLTKEQKQQLRQRAKKADLPMTKYIMIKVFGLDI